MGSFMERVVSRQDILKAIGSREKAICMLLRLMPTKLIWS